MKKIISVLLSIITLVSALSLPISAFSKTTNIDELELMNMQVTAHEETYVDDKGYEHIGYIWVTDKYTYKSSTYDESLSNGKLEKIEHYNDYTQSKETLDYTHGCIKKIDNTTGEEKFIIFDYDYNGFVISNGYIYYMSDVVEYNDVAGDLSQGGIDYVRTDLNGNNREILYHDDYIPHGSGIGGPPEFFVTNDYLYVSKYTIERINLNNKQVKTVYDGEDPLFEGQRWIKVFLVRGDTIYFTIFDNESATLQNAFYKYDIENGLEPIFYIQEERGEYYWVDAGDGTQVMECISTYYTFFAGSNKKEQTGTEYNGVLLGLLENNPLAENGISFYDEYSGDNWFYNFNTEKLIKILGDKGEATVDFEIDKIKGTTTISFDSSWFSKDSSNYNHEISKMSSQLVMLGYASKGTLQQALLDLGFQEQNIEIDKDTSRNEVNYFIAQKEIHIEGKSYNLIITSLIGSYYHQWYSNFDPRGRDRRKNNLNVYADDTEKDNYHLGFADAKEFAYFKLDNFIKNHDNNNEIKLLIAGHSRGAATANLLGAKIIKSQTVGSVAVKKENIYTYTYATPNNAKLTKSEKNDKDYKRIFNIVNPEDFVTEVLPTAWGYSKYGTTYTLPSKSNTNPITYSKYKKSMQSVFSELCNGKKYKSYPLGTYNVDSVINIMTANVNNLDEFYGNKYNAWGKKMTPMDYFKTALCPNVVTPQKTDEDRSSSEKAFNLMLKTYVPTPNNSTLYVAISSFFIENQGIGDITNGWVFDTYFADGHMSQTYCAYMLSMKSNAVTKNKKYWSNSVNCPVDIEIYEKSTNELVGQIIDNQVNTEIAEKENSVITYADGDSKVFILPSDTEYEVKYIGNDNGTMDYIVSEYDSDLGKTSRTNFFDVTIETGETITSDFDENLNELENYTLINKDSSQIIHTSFFTIDYNSGDPLGKIKVSIDIESKGNGEVSESLQACIGDVISASAEPNENEEFKGWYVDDKLVSKETTYTTVAKENMILVAKFTNKSFMNNIIKNQYVLITVVVIIVLIISIFIILKLKRRQNFKTE